MRVGGARGGAQPGSCRGLQALAVGKGLLPLTPDVFFADGQLTVFLQTRSALAVDSAFPFRQQVSGFAGGFLPDDAAQDIEVVDFAENILKLLQVGAP